MYLFFSTSSDSSASRREYRVGQYVVDLVSFEQLVLPMLRNVSILRRLLINVCFMVVLLEAPSTELVFGIN